MAADGARGSDHRRNSASLSPGTLSVEECFGRSSGLGIELLEHELEMKGPGGLHRAAAQKEFGGEAELLVAHGLGVALLLPSLKQFASEPGLRLGLRRALPQAP